MLYIFSLILLLNQALPAQQIDALPLLRVVSLSGKLEHVQGIDVDDTHLWVSSVDRAARQGWLRRFNLSNGQLMNQIAVETGDRYHPGGLVLDGRSIWLPVAEYKPSSSSTIQRRDKTTLKLLSSFTVQDHIGCLTKLGNTLIGGNWDSLTLYRWTLHGQQLSVASNQSGLAFQDWKPWPANRRLALGGGIRAKKQGEVALVDPTTGRPLRSWLAGKTDRGVHLTNEGLAIRNGLLYLLPEDGDSRLFVYQFDNKPAKSVKGR